MFWMKKKPIAEKPKVICKDCKHRSKIKQTLDSGEEEFLCENPDRVTTVTNYVTGGQTILKHACVLWNSEGECKQFGGKTNVANT